MNDQRAGKTRRLFLGLALSESLVSICRDFRRQNREKLPGCRWTEDKNLHVTIFFFGSVADRAVPPLVQELRVLAAGFQPIALEFSGISKAPPGRPPTMVWGNFRVSQDFAGFCESVQRVAGNHVVVRDFDPERCAPHVTLARCSDGMNGADARFSEGDGAGETLRSKSCILFESTLTERGPTYTAIENLPFA